MSIVVTGGAGFIGSCVVKELNNAGINDVIVVDNISTSEKWRNLIGKKYLRYIHKNDFLKELEELADITAIIHMGACSSTTECDFDYLWLNNVEYSKALFDFCNKHKIQFIYASSAATYGDETKCFDDCMNIDKLRPLNRYGYSKQLFDIWLNSKNKDCQCVGLKFFNVYGPNEYHKNGMFSMVYQGFKQATNNGEIKLFKSDLQEYNDGEQRRDFVYVKDVCDVIMWFLSHTDISGLYNVGTGKARSFNDLAMAVFSALNTSSQITYIDMPVELKKQYQYFTEANIEKLRKVGYDKKFHSLEEGVKDYICNYLLDNAYF